MKGFIIAAPCSGSGKTTVTLGIMELLKRRGLVVAPFKVGPDFIDPGYHRLVTGRTSINLDSWMCPREFVLDTFRRHTRFADVAVIEGVMGLFDGLGGGGEGSTAEIASTLDLPVILVVDAKGQAGSVAALVAGFARFDPAVRVAGVIFNNAGSESHLRILTEAVQRALPEVTVLGGMERDENLLIPSRHLGLVTAEENPLSQYYLHRLAKITGDGVDVDRLLELLPDRQPVHPPLGTYSAGNVPIAVARDSAFCFVYEDNLRLLRENGAELLFFSPMEDAALPEGARGLYLPGGYPEVFADQLAANFSMKNGVRQAIESGMPVYAECGGFLYLTRGIVDPAQEGKVRHFLGIFPVTARMLQKRKSLGYREVETVAETPLGPPGIRGRGHEFHYSAIEEMPREVERAYILRRQGVDLGREGYRYRNCLASYAHLHFGSDPAIARGFVESCRRYSNVSAMEGLS